MRWLRSLTARLRAPFLRRQLHRHLREREPGTPLRIVVGAHRIAQPGWIPTEREALDLLDPDGWHAYVREGEISAILAEHVWEHLTPEQAIVAARTCFTFLAPGGYLRAAVPDGLHPDPEYIRRVDVGGTGPAAWDHRVLYDYHSFSDVFTRAGFDVQLLEHFDGNGTFHSVAWHPEDGRVRRSARFDARNRAHPLSYTSLILDARKPA